MSYVRTHAAQKCAGKTKLKKVRSSAVRTEAEVGGPVRTLAKGPTLAALIPTSDLNIQHGCEMVTVSFANLRHMAGKI